MDKAAREGFSRFDARRKAELASYISSPERFYGWADIAFMIDDITIRVGPDVDEEQIARIIRAARSVTKGYKNKNEA